MILNMRRKHGIRTIDLVMTEKDSYYICIIKTVIEKVLTN